MQKSFAGLARRAAYLDESDIAFALFLKNKLMMEQHYQEFFVSVKNFAALKMKEFLKK
jgi:hypothetical protein